MRFDKITNKRFSCTKHCTKLLLLILSVTAPNALLKKLFRFSEKEVWLLDVISFIVMSFQIFCGCLVEQMQLRSTALFRVGLLKPYFFAHPNPISVIISWISWTIITIFLFCMI